MDSDEASYSRSVLIRFNHAKSAGHRGPAGQAGHIGTVPIPARVRTGGEKWMGASGITNGALFRSIDKMGRVWGTGMTPKVLWEIVKAGRAIGWRPSGAQRRRHEPLFLRNGADQPAEPVHRPRASGALGLPESQLVRDHQFLVFGERAGFRVCF